MHGMALNERVSRIYFTIETEMNQAADMRARAWAQVQLGRDYNAYQNLQIESGRVLTSSERNYCQRRDLGAEPPPRKFCLCKVTNYAHVGILSVSHLVFP